MSVASVVEAVDEVEIDTIEPASKRRRWLLIGAVVALIFVLMWPIGDDDRSACTREMRGDRMRARPRQIADGIQTVYLMMSAVSRADTALWRRKLDQMPFHSTSLESAVRHCPTRALSIEVPQANLENQE